MTLTQSSFPHPDFPRIIEALIRERIPECHIKVGEPITVVFKGVSIPLDLPPTEPCHIDEFLRWAFPILDQVLTRLPRTFLSHGIAIKVDGTSTRLVLKLRIQPRKSK